MRIVIDLQPCQSGSGQRGIGRYSLALAVAMVKNNKEHEIIIALSGAFADSIEDIRNAFYGLLPKDKIVVWYPVTPSATIDPNNILRNKLSEILRESFLESLSPDIVHTASLFEGFGDEVVTSIKRESCKIIQVVTLYDLIPLIYKEEYLQDSRMKELYLEKIEYLKQVDLCLAISSSAANEAIEYLNFTSSSVCNISSASDDFFKKIVVLEKDKKNLCAKYCISLPFIMYTGGPDFRKNIESLIVAYARLPHSIKSKFQLVITYSITDEQHKDLQLICKKNGLKEKECIFTGYVSNEDLLLLCNTCHLFVFPSLHEGFGLPVLEAMQCGAAVIASNTSSLPEVVGLDEALFDPYSIDDISRLMLKGLTDQSFRDKLIEHASSQIKKFSWDITAQKALAAMEKVYIERLKQKQINNTYTKLKLAIVSPLPPERTGIADYTAELIPVLSKYYDIEVITDQKEVSDDWIVNNCAIKPVEWFKQQYEYYDRVLYHVGNSHFHAHMIDMLHDFPGAIVLHDFFITGTVSLKSFELNQTLEYFLQELYYSHGYTPLIDTNISNDLRFLLWNFPCNLRVLQDALGVIVHSTYSLNLLSHWYGKTYDAIEIVPLLRKIVQIDKKSEARKRLGYKKDDFIICNFGMMAESKLNHNLLNAYLASSFAKNKNCHLIFVGEENQDEYGKKIRKVINHNKGCKIKITGWVTNEVFKDYLLSSDVSVQLRTLSRGESSAAVLDCMNYAIPTIVNANGSMAELDKEAVWMLEDDFSDEELINALEILYKEDTLRHKLGNKARNVISDLHKPQQCANKYFASIEKFYAKNTSSLDKTIKKISDTSINTNECNELIQVSQALDINYPLAPRMRQLFLDVSPLIISDRRTGIERVIRGITKELLLNPPKGVRVEPIFADQNSIGYRYARQFTYNLLDLHNCLLLDEPISFYSNDVFLSIGLDHSLTIYQQDFYQKMRNHGVTVKFVIHDLLPILMPNKFPDFMFKLHEQWLKIITKTDGAICVSQTVAKEFKNWIKVEAVQTTANFEVDWSHSGGDIKNSKPSLGKPENASILLDKLQSKISFLMVGTLEPRKGHQQVVDAFSHLWQAGWDINLIIVGKQGWQVETLIDNINSHKELGHKLIWLNNASDEFLTEIYANSTCLIMASEGEGFGLPLIEAAQYKIPIIARDIPVFREVAADHAYYFNSKTGKELAGEIKEWIKLFKQNNTPQSKNMAWLTWEQSAEQLKQILKLI